MSEYLKFDIQEINVIEENPESNFAILELDFFSSGMNLHDTFVSEETLLRTANTIKNCALIWDYDPVLDDAFTHTKNQRICGFIPENSEIKVKEGSGGRKFLTTNAYLWKKYSGNILEFFKRDDAKKPISVEMLVKDMHKNDSGIMEMFDFVYKNVTILGSFVQSAIVDAEARIMSFSVEEYKEDVMKEFGKLPNSRYSEIDLSIPISIKKKVKKALEQHKQTGGQTASVLAASRHLANSDKISPEKAKFIKKHLSKKDDELKYNLLGGKECFTWTSDLCQQFEKLDAETVSYFAGNIPEEEVSKQEFLSEDDLKSKSTKKEEISMDVMDKEVEKTEELPIEKMAEKVEEPETEKVEEPEKEEMAADTKQDEEKETPEEEKAETPAEEKEEEKQGVEKKFAFPAKMSVEKMSAMFSDDMDDDDVKMACGELEKMSKGEECDFGLVMGGMFAKMCKMEAACNKFAEDSKVYMAENEELKKFKADVEGKQKEFAVNKTLKELGDKVEIPDEVMSEMKESAANFSMDNIDAWKNSCKARVFDFAVKKVDGGKDEEKVTVVGFHWDVSDNGNGKKSSVWDKLG